MNPAEFLDGGDPAGYAFLVHTSVWIGKADAIFDFPEFAAVRFPVRKGEAYEIAGWTVISPVHSEEGHTIAAMELEREGRISVAGDDLEFFRHVSFLSKRRG